MTRYAVDVDGLLTLVGRMRRFQQELTATREDVQRRIDDLHLTWAGSAAAAQAGAHAEWDSAAVQAQEALAALHAMARTAHGNYTSAAQANRRMWAL